MLGSRDAAVLGFHQWGVDDKLTIIRVDADPEEPERVQQACGRARRRCQADPAPPDRRARRAQSRTALAPRGDDRAAGENARTPAKARTPDRLSRRHPRRAARRRHLRRRGDADRFCGAAGLSRSTSRGHSSRLAIRTRSAGAMRPRSACRMPGAMCRGRDLRRRRIPVHGHRDRNRHAPPHTAGLRRLRRRRLRQCAAHSGGALRQPLIASDLTNPEFVRFAESFGAAAERARTPAELRAALNRAFKRRDVPTLIEVPVPCPRRGSSSCCHESAAGAPRPTNHPRFAPCNRA